MKYKRYLILLKTFAYIGRKIKITLDLLSFETNGSLMLNKKFINYINLIQDSKKDLKKKDSKKEIVTVKSLGNDCISFLRFFSLNND